MIGLANIQMCKYRQLSYQLTDANKFLFVTIIEYSKRVAIKQQNIIAIIKIEYEPEK